MKQTFIFSTLLSILFLSFILSGCTPKLNTQAKEDLKTIQNEQVKEKPKSIKDIYKLSQKPSSYLIKYPNIKIDNQNSHNKTFNERYFKPWYINKVYASKKEAMWGFGYSSRETYGQNYQKLDKKWYKKVKQNANFKKYNTLLKKAITIKNTNMRVLPTDLPIFLDPEQAGEGFPFDYNQNSAVYINTPLFISHLSLDRAWAFVETSFATGWIKVSDIAILSLRKRQVFQSGYYGVAAKDNFPLYDTHENFLDYIKMGTIFPIKKAKFMVAQRSNGINGKLVYTTSPHIYQKPVTLNQKNLNYILNQVVGESYGWGGLYGTRDCSSMTRDIFAVFGIYLERNSYGQKLAGKYISLEKLSNKEKKKKIREIGKPFLTLLYQKGHVMLYVGDYKNEPIIFHQAWGIGTLDKNDQEGRYIIGKAAFTTLEVGKGAKDLDPNSTLINKLEGMILLK
jgi:hypothetical protein